MEAKAKLNNYPTSPRKMRLLADLIRGMKVDNALSVLQYNGKHASLPLRKLLLSAVNNWKAHNEGSDESNLVVTTIFVDCGRVLKRMRPAPQGRGYRVRKRSNHVTLMVDAVAPKPKHAKKAATKATPKAAASTNQTITDSKPAQG